MTFNKSDLDGFYPAEEIEKLRNCLGKEGKTLLSSLPEPTEHGIYLTDYQREEIIGLFLNLPEGKRRRLGEWFFSRICERQMQRDIERKVTIQELESLEAVKVLFAQTSGSNILVEPDIDPHLIQCFQNFAEEHGSTIEFVDDSIDEDSRFTSLANRLIEWVKGLHP